jgi:hypothetical protein
MSSGCFASPAPPERRHGSDLPPPHFKPVLVLVLVLVLVAVVASRTYERVESPSEDEDEDEDEDGLKIGDLVVYSA